MKKQKSNNKKESFAEKINRVNHKYKQLNIHGVNEPYNPYSATIEFVPSRYGESIPPSAKVKTFGVLETIKGKHLINYDTEGTDLKNAYEDMPQTIHDYNKTAIMRVLGVRINHDSDLPLGYNQYGSIVGIKKKTIKRRK